MADNVIELPDATAHPDLVLLNALKQGFEKVVVIGLKDGEISTTTNCDEPTGFWLASQGAQAIVTPEIEFEEDIEE